jgi:two-component system LytT family response regulator
MAKIRTVVVDDEPLARERVRALLETEPDIEIVAECRDGDEAVEAVRRHAPDLLFLDVQIPERNGFEVLEALGAEKAPVVVFVTAYDQYALQAFEVHAVDYLLKPFDEERFRKALGRAREAVGRPRGIEVNDRLLSLLKDLKQPPGYPRPDGGEVGRPPSSSCAPRRWTGSSRRATTCASTSVPSPTCCARR